MANHKLCSKENIAESISYLSQELCRLGLSTIHASDSGVDAVKIVNWIHQLLLLIKNKDQEIEDLEDRKKRLCSDLNNLKASEARLKESLAEIEKAALLLKDGKNQLKEKLKTDNIILRSTKNEVRWLKQVEQQYNAKHALSIQKKKQKLFQLNDKLRRALSGKPQGRLYGIDISHIVGRTDRKRGQWKNESNEAKDEEDFCNFVLGSFEARQENLLNDNALLKDTVTSLERETNMMKSKEDDLLFLPGPGDLSSLCEWNNLSENIRDTSLDLAANLHNEAFETIGERLKTNVARLESLCAKYIDRHKVDSGLCSACSSLCDRDSPVLDDPHKSRLEEIARLEEKIKVCESVIEKQREVIDAPVNRESTPNRYLVDGFVLEERDRLFRARQYFEEQKENFLKEKEAFTKAAMQLGRQKQELETGKVSWRNSENVGWKMPQVVSESPERNFGSPLPCPSLTEPSTPDLYDFFGFTCDRKEN